MDERDYEILLTVYKEKSLTKAADTLFTSQPSLSYRIKQLEKDLDIQILLRSGKSIEFTPEGEHLVSFAQNMNTNIQNLKDHLLAMTKESHGNLRIAVTTITARYYLPEVLKKFSATYPNVKLHLLSGDSAHVLQLLENENVHLGIVRGDHQWNEGKILLGREDMCIISKHPINLSDLPKIPQVYRRVTSTYNSEWKNENKSPLSWEIQNWWYENFTSPPLFSMEVGSYEICKELVRIGLGYAIIPKLFLTAEDDLNPQQLVLNNGKTIRRNTWLLYRDAVSHLNFVKSFLKMFEQHHPH